MILDHNVTESLIIKNSSPSINSRQQRQEQEQESSSNNNNNNNDVASIIMTALRDGIATPNSSLKSLRLSGIHYFDNADNGNDHDNDWFTHIFIKNTSLLELDVSCSPLSYPYATDLARALLLLPSPLEPNTSKVHTKNNTEKTTTLSRTASSLQLQYLNVSCCHLDDRSLTQLLRSIQYHPTLTHLNLSRNYLAAPPLQSFSRSATAIADEYTTQALDALAAVFGNNNSALTSLDVSYQQQQISSKRQRTILLQQQQQNYDTDERRCLVVQQESHKELHHHHHQQHATVVGSFVNTFKALSKNTTIQSINLCGNHGCFDDPKIVQAFTDCLISNTVLNHVDVALCSGRNNTGTMNNNTDDDHDGSAPHDSTLIKHIVQYCIPYCGNHQLQSLILFHDDDDDDDDDDEDEGNKICQMLVKSLQTNTAILNLGSHRCRHRHRDTIGKTRLVNNNNNHKTSDDIGCWCTIQHILNTNRGGRRALFCSSDNKNNAILPLATWSYILARVANSSASINNNNNDDDDASSLYYDHPNHEEHVKEDKEDPGMFISTTSSTVAAAAASVLYELLHGPALFDTR